MTFLEWIETREGKMFALGMLAGVIWSGISLKLGEYFGILLSLIGTI